VIETEHNPMQAAESVAARWHGELARLCARSSWEQLSLKERQRVAEHLAVCDTCQAVTATDSRLLGRTRPADSPSPALPNPCRTRLPLLFAASAMIALLGFLAIASAEGE